MQTRKVAGVLVAVTALALAVWLARSAPPPAATAATAGAPGRAAQPPATPSGTPAHYRPLLGSWLRPDGGYVLEVRGVASDGRATVAYFNPRPIRVARAEARQERELVGLFVEFDDQNYRGSTYTLGYHAESDELRGIYYQAALGQRFDVAFTRRR